ncbi:hypothetical protein M433DRAFT_10058 [Acidomyces richmondensis BFW]|nr:hypothetical protein M433DRAFT_10058 [Acidomyces richmondensis BFW]
MAEDDGIVVGGTCRATDAGEMRRAGRHSPTSSHPNRRDGQQRSGRCSHERNPPAYPGVPRRARAYLSIGQGASPDARPDARPDESDGCTYQGD